METFNKLTHGIEKAKRVALNCFACVCVSMCLSVNSK